MPPKRARETAAAGDGGGEGGPDDFTKVVKKRLSASTRTGQACDRCKVRKIRCDGLPGGCSPCIQNRTECKTTDRISQKAIPRGYLENLEAQYADLQNRNKELEAALALGGRVAPAYASAHSPTDWVNDVGPPKPQPSFELHNLFSSDRWKAPPPRTNQPSPYSAISNGSGSAGIPSRQSTFRPAPTSSHYLGISAGSSYLSSMKATALSLLGIDIDLSILDPHEPSTREPSLDESYNSCLATMLNVNPMVHKAEVPPSLEEAMGLVETFWMVSHPYLPVLHKPTFNRLVERIYNDKSFDPSPAQMAQVHMVFAIVQYQTAVRERMKHRGAFPSSSQSAIEASRRSYHYASSLMYYMLLNPRLEDLQAIALILQHVRSFPKPGGGWPLARLALTLCVELGLHRSTTKWVNDGLKPNIIEVEIRKRVFWIVLTIEVSFATKLGRPLSLREGDFDTELPERIDDELITEEGFLKREDGNDECSFEIALLLFKHCMVTIDLYSKLYGTKTPSREQYVSLVEELEAKLNKWRDSIPTSFSLDSPDPAKRFQSAHLSSWYHETRTLIRHPSLSLSPSPSFTNECIKICVESSRELLRITDDLRKSTQYLDTTWYGATVQLLAILTILFSAWDKRDTITKEEIDGIKEDMDLCMDIMGDVGSLLGQPNKLRDLVQVLAHSTMELLNQKSEQRGRVSPSGTGRSIAVPIANGAGFPAPPPALKLPSSQQADGQFSQGSGFPVNTETLRSNNMSVFNDGPVAAVPESANLFETPQGVAASNVFNSGAFVATSQPPFGGLNSQGWGFAGNESWREYIHNISNIAADLDPQETYSASALMALNQDCNNAGLFAAANGGAAQHAANTAAAGLGLMSSQGTGGSPGVTGQSPHGNFPPPNSDNSGQWQMQMGGFNYSDGNVGSSA